MSDAARSPSPASQDSNHDSHEAIAWVDRLAARYVAWLRRRATRVLTISLLLCLPAGWATAQLFVNLRASFEELLPDNARSVVGLRAIRKRIGDTSQLTLVLTGPPGVSGDLKPHLKRFADDLAKELRAEPKGMVKAVDYQIIAERDFFKQHGWLYLELGELTKLRDDLRARVDYERKKNNPLYIDLDDEAKPPKVDIDGLRKKHAAGSFDFDRFKDGYFVNPEGTTLAIIVRMPRGVSGLTPSMQLLETAKRIVTKLDPKKYDPRIVVGYAGDVPNTVEETASLAEDIVLSTVLVILFCAVVIVAYFRRVRAIYLLGVPLLVGTLFTFAIAFVAVGYLNSNTAFLASIVVGNGVNFGIILLARYSDLRDAQGQNDLVNDDAAHGRFIEACLATSLSHTAMATFTAAAAASIAYGSLVITDFRGFNQFGFIGGIGMVLCWITSFTLMPALIMVVERRAAARARRPGAKPAKPHKANPRRFATAVARLVIANPRGFSLVTIAAILASGFVAVRYLRDPFEFDFAKLRSKSSFAKGAGMWDKKVDQVFGRYLTPTVILTDSLEHSERIAAALNTVLKKEGEQAVIKNVDVAGKVVPPAVEQEAKLPVIAELRKILAKDIRPYLTDSERAELEPATPPENLKVLTMADMPASIQDRVADASGATTSAVLVYPKVGVNMWDGRNAMKFEKTLREGEQMLGEQWLIGSYSLLFSDMVRAVGRDGPRATILSLIGVVLLCFITFGSLRHGGVVAITLCSGVAIMAAALALLGVRLNFLNFIAFPITFGIGVDYGVNVYRRYLVEGAGRLVNVIRTAGSAVALASCTTVIGYSALLIADNRGLVSFGIAANLGEFTCLAVGVIGLPALLRVVELRRGIGLDQPTDKGQETASAGSSAAKSISG